MSDFIGVSKKETIERAIDSHVGAGRARKDHI